MAKRKSDLISKSDQESELNGKLAKRKSSGLTIEQSNALSHPDFLNQISGIHWKTYTRKDKNSAIKLCFADDLSDRDLRSCFKLIETTSRHDYEPSSFGWYPKRKLREMKEEEMRYLIIQRKRSSEEDNTEETEFEGFLSFMLTYDSSPLAPVLYIYEIHLAEQARGRGLGKYLMQTVEMIAQKFQVDKVMLTCFKSNKNATGFYSDLGYGIDACSPSDRKTRNKVVKADYIIMSKGVKTDKEWQSLAVYTDTIP